MGFILTVIGLLLLLLSLAAIGFGVFMAADPKNRRAGRFFAVWFVFGTLCFLVAGAAFALQSGAWRKPLAKRTRQDRDSSAQTKQDKAVS